MEEEDRKIMYLKTEKACEIIDAMVERHTTSLPRPTANIIRLSKGKSKDNEEAVLLLSDLQIGHKTPSTSATIIAHRMERLATSLIKIVKIHNQAYPVKKLNIFMLGDCIQSEAVGFKVSLDELELTLMDQIFGDKGAVTLISNFLETVYPYFPDGIHCYCVFGNHGNQGRFASTTTNWDSIVYKTLETRFSKYIRIHWYVEDKNFYQKVKIFNKTFLIVHGDQIPMWMNIPWYGQTQRAMRWQGSLPGDLFNYMCVGHFHIPARYMWNNVEIIANGCFVSEDAWVIQKMGMSTVPAQVLFGVHPRKGVTWHYTLKLDAN
jgi:hypothetical protein